MKSLLIEKNKPATCLIHLQICSKGIIIENIGAALSFNFFFVLFWNLKFVCVWSLFFFATLVNKQNLVKESARITLGDRKSFQKWKDTIIFLKKTYSKKMYSLWKILPYWFYIFKYFSFLFLLWMNEWMNFCCGFSSCWNMFVCECCSRQ